MTSYLLILGGQVSILMLAALAAGALLRRRSAALRHWVLSAAFLCAAALPVLQAMAPRWEVAPTPRPTAQAAAVSKAVDAAAGGDEQIAFSVLPAVRGEGRWLATAARTLPVAWAAGAALAIGLLAVGLGRLRWLARRSRPIDDPRWTATAARIARAMNLRRSVGLLQSDHPAILAAWGWRRPVVMLPRSAAGWPAADIDIVLRHELAHIQRGDWWAQLLAAVVFSLNWFNPLVWLVSRRLRAESERACDDAVLKLGIAGPDYAAHLVSLAQRLNAQRRWQPPFPAPAMARASTLERRVAAMLDTHVNRAPLSAVGRIAVLALALGVALPIAGLAASAQAPAGTGQGVLQGLVLDPAGRPADVQVNVTGSGLKPRLRTGKTGRFELTGLPAGDYAIEITRPGFKTLKTTVPVASGVAKREFRLQLGSVQETITVSGGAAAAPGAAGAPPASKPQASASSASASPCTPDPASGGDVRPPRKLRDVKPEYPAALRDKKVTGRVVIEAVIGKDGAVHSLQVLEAPHPDLGRAAMDAVGGWQFEPTLLNCEPADVQMRVSVTFK